MNTFLLRAGAVTAALSVMLGAFGAHALKESLGPEQLQVFETGVKYQFYHALALLICGVLSSRYQVKTAGRLFLAGIIAFSGSLYLLSTRSVTGLESWTWLGPVTPLGGLCLIAGWILLAVAVGKPVPSSKP